MVVGGCLEIQYVGAQPSCVITADATAKTLSSSIGVAGLEAPDAAFGVAGAIDLTSIAVDTLQKLATLIDSYADYQCSVLYGTDVSPQNVLDEEFQTNLAGSLSGFILFNVALLAGNYCSSADVSAEMQNIPAFTPTTRPTLTEVDGWCTDIAADINAILSTAGISLPIIGVDALKILRVLAVWGVCARVLRSLEVSNIDAPKMYQRLYDDKLQQIKNTPSMLSSTPTPLARGPTSYNPGTIERNFRREEQDW